MQPCQPYYQVTEWHCDPAFILLTNVVRCRGGT